MRKSVSSVLAALAVTAGLTLTPGVAFADDNSGNDGGVGGSHNHDSHGLVGGVLDGNCNVNVNVLGSSRCNNAENYGRGIGYPGWVADGDGYYPTLYNQSQLNLVEYGYGTPVSVCNYPSWGAFEGFARPRLRGFDSFRSRFGRTVGAWNTGWDRVRREGGCGSTVVEQPTIVEQEQPVIYSPQRSGRELSSPQVRQPSESSVNTGDGSTVK